MKKVSLMVMVLVVMMMLSAVMFMAARPDTALGQSGYRTADQVLNSAYDSAAAGLKTKTVSPATTVFKVTSLAPDTDSGTALTLPAQAVKWQFMNLHDTCPVFINFENAATVDVSLKVLAKTTVAFDSKVTTVHAIASDTASVQVLGAY